MFTRYPPGLPGFQVIHLIGRLRSLAVILGAIIGSLRRVAWTFLLILLITGVYRHFGASARADERNAA
jgi:hypothetical protein